MKVKLRSMVVARPGHTLIMCDLSQAESWIVAHEAEEENMKHALKFSDIHTETARALFGFDVYDSAPPNERKIMRYVGKRNNHANSYGMEEYKGAAVINKDSDKPPYVTVTVAEFREQQQKWKSHYFNVPNWWLEIQGELDRNRTLTNAYGRRRTFYGAWGKELFKEAYAFKPQSSVADHFTGLMHPDLGVKGGFLEVKKQFVDKFNGEILLLNHSHDSLMLDVPKSIANEIAQQTMELLHRPLVIKGEEFWIPVDCEMGERWGEMEKFGEIHKYKKAA